MNFLKVFQTRLTVGLTLLALGVGACRTPMPGYRHEGQGPDERLLDLVTLLDAQREANGGGGDPVDLVDGGRIQNELRRLHLEYPGHVPTLYVLADLVFREGRKERAAAYLDDLFAVQWAHPEAGILRAQIAICEGNLPAATRVLERQIRLNPDHPGLREALSSTHFMAGRYDEARTTMERARRLGAPVWRVAFNLGLIEESSGNHTLAMQRYEVAFAENPDFPPALARYIGLRAEFGEVVR
jgi:tetratricopeptide (TPR) repeat protein